MSQKKIESLVHLNPRTHLWNRSLDVWTLGGLSLLLAGLVAVANAVRAESSVVDSRFLQLAAVFSMLTLFCNYPHFLASYRLAYGRGGAFIRAHALTLILAPASLLLLFGAAFVWFDADVSRFSALMAARKALSAMDLSIPIVGSGRLGMEVLGATLWLMYLMVGWHYAKQAYGCMMVYAFFDRYRLSSWQKRVFKFSVIALAVHQFVALSSLATREGAGSTALDSRLSHFHPNVLVWPDIVPKLTLLTVAVLAIVGLGIFVLNYRRSGQKPSLPFLIPWLALHAWWIPLQHIPEYSLLMVPFFHSLQYLAMASRMEVSRLQARSRFETRLTAGVLVTLALGFVVFEFTPAILDDALNTDVHQTALFFTTAVAVFFNLHHFLIDSIIWKFQDPDIQRHLLTDRSRVALRPKLLTRKIV